MYPRLGLSINKKNITIFHLKIINCKAVKNRSILHRHVCVIFFCLDIITFVGLFLRFYQVLSEHAWNPEARFSHEEAHILLFSF